MRYFFSFLFLAILFPVCLFGEWTPPRVVLPSNREHPVIALPAEGLKRLRTELEGGPQQKEVQALINAGDKAIRGDLEFPLRGGVHSQWYNCPDCETRLKTISPTEHECRICGKTYSGSPFDDVLFSQEHGRNLRRLEEAAWAYILTEDDRYAVFAREVLLGYAERYLQYEFQHASRKNSAYAQRAGGRLFDQTLTEAFYLQQHILPAYDLVAGSRLFTPADHRAIREKLIVPMVEGMLRNDRGKSNWQSFHNTAMFWAGAILRNPEWMERSIYEPENGFLFQMENSVLSDGMWYENSWSYHFYTYRALGRHAQGAAHIGIDLWNHPKMRKMLTLPLDFVMADGSVPRIGNATTVRPLQLAANRPALMEAAYRAYLDDIFLPILPKKITEHSVLYGNSEVIGRGETASRKSTVMESGHAILRTAGEPGLTAALNFAPFGGYHSHFDKLSFVFFGFGEELGVDRGRAAAQAYNLPIHREWYRATISHNTVLVDGKSQAEAGGELLFFNSTDEEVAAVAKTEAYEDVDHRRMLFMTADYLLVFDELEAANRRRFDWFYHNRGKDVVSAVVSEKADLSFFGKSADYFADMRSGVSDFLLKAHFPGENVTVYLTEAGAPGSRLTVANGAGSTVSERIPLLFITREGRQVQFVSVLEPVRNGDEPRVGDVTLAMSDEGPMISIEFDGSRHRYVLRADHSIVRTRSSQ